MKLTFVTTLLSCMVMYAFIREHTARRIFPLAAG